MIQYFYFIKAKRDTIFLLHLLKQTNYISNCLERNNHLLNYKDVLCTRIVFLVKMLMHLPEPFHEKINNLHMRKQRRRSASH